MPREAEHRRSQVLIGRDHREHRRLCTSVIWCCAGAEGWGEGGGRGGGEGGATVERTHLWRRDPCARAQCR
eukprot:scaffold28557_cov34-Tisochrysis_lutea.AAC.1